MNIIAIDIGNTNVTVGLFLDDTEKYIESIPGGEKEKIKKLLVSAWEQIPYVEGAKVRKRNGIIAVSSVKDEWTDTIVDICRNELDEKIKLVGKDIPLPMETAVDNISELGTDRVVSAAAAFAVVQDAVVIANLGTAFTIDLVDEEGVFMGGTISPGFDISAEALKAGTAKLPKVNVKKPKDPVGGNTRDAINCGLYYSAVGLLRAVTEKYAEQIGKWPQTIVTGGAAGIIKDDCDFVDSWVPNLAVRGIVLAYQKYLFDEAEIAELNENLKNNKKK